MRLDIGYTYVSQGSQEITINESEYLDWARSGPKGSPLAIPDEELLKDEDKILFYLNSYLGPERVSNLIGWGEEVIEVGDVYILDS